MSTVSQLTQLVVNDLFTHWVEKNSKNLLNNKKIKWSKETPLKEGIYWVRYREGNKNKITLCSWMMFDKGKIVATICGDSFSLRPGDSEFSNVGDGEVKSIYFGPEYK